MERKIVIVLEGLAEYRNMTLGELLEKIVLHSFEAVPGQEGECALVRTARSPLAAIPETSKGSTV